jgi:hypothetical protein
VVKVFFTSLILKHYLKDLVDVGSAGWTVLVEALERNNGINYLNAKGKNR